MISRWNEKKLLGPSSDIILLSRSGYTNHRVFLPKFGTSILYNDMEAYSSAESMVSL